MPAVLELEGAGGRVASRQAGRNGALRGAGRTGHVQAVPV